MRCLYLLVVVFFFALLASGYAREVMTPEGPVYTHFPESFDYIMVVDQIDDKGMTAEDQYFPFAENIRIMTKRKMHSQRSAIRAGQKVGFVLDDQTGKVTILCSLE